VYLLFARIRKADCVSDVNGALYSHMFYSFHNVDVYFILFGICGLDCTLSVESLGLLCRMWQTTCL
jgi:hypothetical protein